MRDHQTVTLTDSPEDPFQQIPGEIRQKADLAGIPGPLSEQEIDTLTDEIFSQNNLYRSFRGGGVYHRYIPAAVSWLLSRGEFVTPYTPYQPEVSQGILQALFEYQSVVCRLTGMDVANASLYDGGSALAEAVLLLRRRFSGRKKILILGELNPRHFAVVRTYNSAEDCIEWQKCSDLDIVERELEKGQVIGLIVSQPDFRGEVLDLSGVAELKGRYPDLRVICCFEPVSQSILAAPADWGADIAVAEGLGCGVPLTAGGPALGIFAAKEEFLRQLPGRLSGMTEDAAGERAFTLTLQTREQHIRREKATSNICTNQTLIALGFLFYTISLGATGLRRAALQSYQRSHELHEKLSRLNSVNTAEYPFFHEFVYQMEGDLGDFFRFMKKEGIDPGIRMDTFPGGRSGEVLVAATECNSSDDCELYAQLLERWGTG